MHHRNLLANPEVVFHLEDAMTVVIVEGRATVTRPTRALARRLAEVSKAKYGYAMSLATYQKTDLFAVAPRRAYAWTSFPKDATRFVWRRRDSNP